MKRIMPGQELFLDYERLLETLQEQVKEVEDSGIDEDKLVRRG
jgi:hypothetical protein